MRSVRLGESVNHRLAVMSATRASRLLLSNKTKNKRIQKILLTLRRHRKGRRKRSRKTLMTNMTASTHKKPKSR